MRFLQPLCPFVNSTTQSLSGNELPYYLQSVWTDVSVSLVCGASKAWLHVSLGFIYFKYNLNMTIRDREVSTTCTVKKIHCMNIGRISNRKIKGMRKRSKEFRPISGFAWSKSLELFTKGCWPHSNTVEITKRVGSQSILKQAEQNLLICTAFTGEGAKNRGAIMVNFELLSKWSAITNIGLFGKFIINSTVSIHLFNSMIRGCYISQQ